MRILEDPEYFIGKSGANILHTLKIQQDLRKSIYPSQYAFRLRSGHQLFAWIFSQRNWYMSTFESDGVILVSVKYVTSRPCGICGYCHLYPSSTNDLGEIPAFYKPIVIFLPDTVIEQVTRIDAEFVKHPGGKENTVSRMMTRI